jgi:hypothetical protein
MGAGKPGSGQGTQLPDIIKKQEVLVIKWKKEWRKDKAGWW